MKRSWGGGFGRSRGMKGLGSFALPRLAMRQTPESAHPGGDLLTAFAEGTVLREERSAILAHLGECQDCRDVLALTTAGDADPLRTASQNGGAAWWGWPLAATAAVLCFALAAVWQFSEFRHAPAPLVASDFERLQASKPHPPAVIAALTGRSTANRQGGGGAEKTATANARARARQGETALGARSVPRSQAAPVSPADGRDESVFAIAQDSQAQTISPSVARRQMPGLTRSATQAGGALASNSMFSSSGEISATKQFVTASHSGANTIWSLERLPGPGTVSKSDDGGKTWMAVRIDGVTPFYALSAAGSNIWIGGDGGKLFHSANDGLDWAPVSVGHGSTRLTETIIGIDGHGETVLVKTRSGEVYETRDGGAHWQP